MSKAALLILFNHNYEANIDRLEKLYASRFDDIFFIMPFYKGKKENVIAVYENSYYFEGYVAKALEAVRNRGFEHYIIIGDDLILNPRINQDNYKESFQISEKMGFMPGLFLLSDTSQTVPDRPMAPYWPALIDGLNFRVDQKGIEVAKFLPSAAEAVTLLKRHGLEYTSSIPASFFISPLQKIPFSKAAFEHRKRAAKHLFVNYKHLFSKRELNYPIVGGYSDICIIPDSSLDKFIAYCGIFAALNLFAEIGLPTAFAFSVETASFESQLKAKGLTFWNPQTVGDFQDKYNLSLQKLFDEWPRDTLYVHPIKLSRWK